MEVAPGSNGGNNEKIGKKSFLDKVYDKLNPQEKDKSPEQKKKEKLRADIVSLSKIKTSESVIPGLAAFYSQNHEYGKFLKEYGIPEDDKDVNDLMVELSAKDINPEERSNKHFALVALLRMKAEKILGFTPEGKAN